MKNIEFYLKNWKWLLWSWRRHQRSDWLDHWMDHLELNDFCLKHFFSKMLCFRDKRDVQVVSDTLCVRACVRACVRNAKKFLNCEENLYFIWVRYIIALLFVKKHYTTHKFLFTQLLIKLYNQNIFFLIY